MRAAFVLLSLGLGAFACPQTPKPVWKPVPWKVAGVTFEYDGHTLQTSGKASDATLNLGGGSVDGEIRFFATPKGRYDAEALYKSDTQRTKEADEAKGFSHVRSATRFAGLNAVESQQRYTWKGVPVASTCVYAVDKGRAWIVRLWWTPGKMGAQDAADHLIKSFKRL